MAMPDKVVMEAAGVTQMEAADLVVALAQVHQAVGVQLSEAQYTSKPAPSLW